MAMRKFIIYYNDGTKVRGGGDDDEEVTLTFSKKWLEAPSDGVVGVIVEDPALGREDIYPYEYYYQMPINDHGKGTIGGSMKAGAFLRQTGIMKFGGWTDRRNYQKRIGELMKNDEIPRYVKTKEHQEDDMD